MNKIIYEYEAVNGVWSVSGEGPMRPIVAEGNTLSEAKDAFHSIYGRQYEEMERHTAQAIAAGRK